MTNQKLIITEEQILAGRVDAARKDQSFQLYLKMTFKGKELKLTLDTDVVMLTLHHAFSAGVTVGCMLKDIPAPKTPSFMRGNRRNRN